MSTEITQNLLLSIGSAFFPFCCPYPMAIGNTRKLPFQPSLRFRSVYQMVFGFPSSWKTKQRALLGVRLKYSVISYGYRKIDVHLTSAFVFSLKLDFLTFLRPSKSLSLKWSPFRRAYQICLLRLYSTRAISVSHIPQFGNHFFGYD
jgi:hypothetical protein